MLYPLLKTAHLLAIVVWVGGMSFTHFFLRPALGVLEPAARLALMHEVLRRFFAAVLVASLLALFTGLWMLGRVASESVRAGASVAWPIGWWVMVVLGTLMVAIFGHIRFVLFKRFAAARGAGDLPGAAAGLAKIRTWVGVNLALGLVVILAAKLG
jgi:uncharacterized membrane protein